MRSKLIFPGGWIRTNYAHSVFGGDAMEPCEVCRRASCGTVWIHLETRVVRCWRHEPRSVVDWSDEPKGVVDWSGGLLAEEKS